MRIFRSLAAFLGGKYEKVFAHYFKTFSLGVRRRAVAVSVLAVLLAGLNPCYAEFGNADSQNLSQINQKLTTVNSWLSSLAQKLDHLSVIENTMKQASYAEFGNADSQNLSQINQKLTTVNSWLSSLAQKLDHLSVIENTMKQASSYLYNIRDRVALIESALNSVLDYSKSIDSTTKVMEDHLKFLRDLGYSDLAFSARDGFVTSTLTFDTMFTLPEAKNNNMFDDVFWGTSKQNNLTGFLFQASPWSASTIGPVEPGVTYSVYLRIPGKFSARPTSFSSSRFSFDDDFLFYEGSNGGKYFTSVLLQGTPNANSFDLFYLQFSWAGAVLDQSSGGGPFYASIVPLSDYVSMDNAFEDATNPGQSDANQQVSTGADQLDQIDDKVFEDINKYKGDLTFSVADWSEAAAGLSYISNIFMIIWDNAPMQPIVLSLMLGLATLLLGRGVSYAVKHRGDKEDDG